MSDHDIHSVRERVSAIRGRIRMYLEDTGAALTAQEDLSLEQVLLEECGALLADHARLQNEVSAFKDPMGGEGLASQGSGQHLCGSRNEATGGATAALASDLQQFVNGVAAIEFHDEVGGPHALNYAVTNTLHGRGSLDKVTRRTVASAIRTLQAVIEAAKKRATPDGGEAIHAQAEGGEG